MTTQQKKPSNASGAAKNAASAAADAANRGARTAFNAVESTRSSAENVVKIGSNAMKDLISSGTGEMQRAQEKMYEMSREGAANMSKSADMASKAMYEMITIGRDNLEACLECSATFSNLAKTMSQEVSDYMSRTFSDQVELSKEAFSCRTLNDMIELQNKVVKQSIDSYFNECMKLYNMVFECASEAVEPINQRISDATEQMSRVLAA